MQEIMIPAGLELISQLTYALLYVLVGLNSYTSHWSIMDDYFQRSVLKFDVEFCWQECGQRPV